MSSYSAELPQKTKKIKMGAEAVIYNAQYHSNKCIIKQRVVKRYRLPTLDQNIRKQRTIAESRIMYTALKYGVRVPAVLFVDLQEGLMVMEYIPGPQIKTCIGSIDINKYFTEIGMQIANLHQHNIIHGDLTTSNIILDQKRDATYLIDFGLAKVSTHIEDKAVDLMVFKRTLDSTHFQYHQQAWSAFLKGYFAHSKSESEMLKRLATIQARTRYT